MADICLLIFPSQTQVSGITTNTVLRELRPDTEYKVTLVPIYPDTEGKRASENGKTSECIKFSFWDSQGCDSKIHRLDTGVTLDFFN